jgi:uncharacterized membrane protein
MKREWTYGLVLAVAAALAGMVFLPVAEAALGGTGAGSALARLAFARVCHQDPARSLIIAGALLPVCARCAGIYLGFFIGFSGRLLLRAPDRDRPLPRATMALGFAPLCLDGALNAAGLLATPPELRLVTGLIFGIVAARALWPALLDAGAGLRLPRLRGRRAAPGETGG